MPDLASDSAPRTRSLIIVALFALYAAGLTRDIDAPWTGMHDWNGAFYSYLARNLLRYPLSITHALPVAELGLAPPADISRYANHPPLIEWLLAAVFSVLGVSEFAARLVPIAFSLASLWFLWRITDAALGRTTATIACMFYAIMPMTAFFGRMVDQEPLCMCFILLAAWAWYASLGRIATRASARTLRVAWLTGLVGCILTDWVGAIATGIFLLEAAWRAHRRECSRRTLVLAAIIPAFALAAVLLLLVYGGMNGSWASLRDMFFSRATSSNPTGIQRDISTHGGPLQMTRDNATDGIIACALIGAACFLISCRARIRAKSPAIAPLLTLTAIGALWILAFWNQFQRHNYWQFYLAPSICIFAALGLAALHSMFRKLAPQRARLLTALVLAVTIALALRGTNDYFRRRSEDPARIDAWTTIRAGLNPDQTAVLLFNPYRIDQRGAYSYRNIVPPHFAFYLDRPIAVAQTLEEIQHHVGHGSVLVIDTHQLPRVQPIIDALASTFPQFIAHPYIIFDLDPRLHRSFGSRIR